MKKAIGTFLLPLLPFLLFILPYLPLFLPSCASIGNPTGGKFDTIPPLFIGSKPDSGATGFKGNKIELHFNEYLSIDEPSKKVIITPPQSKMPIIKAIGKKITIELKDSLKENTTYTFDFTDGIVDNNEKNPLEGFTFAVSTGDVLDSLIVSGIVLNAENLEPMPGIMVGLHSDLNDSAFTKLPFLRTSMTNDKGQFWIRNIKPGTYKLYALNDQKRSFRYQQPGEDIAFSDSLITPGFVPAIRMDTVRKDSVNIDTIKEIHYTRFIPDDMILRLFKEPENTQYLLKNERPMEQQLVLRFNSNIGLPPDLYLLDDPFWNEPVWDDPFWNADLSDWFIPEYSPYGKDITYWITDSLIYKQDTLRVETHFLRSDSLNNLIPFTDTLKFVWKNKEVPKKNNKKETKVKADVLRIDWTAKGVMDVFDTLKITFSEPVINLDTDKIRIQQKVDTSWVNRKFPIVSDSLNPRVFYVNHEWPYEGEYRITVDSASVFSIYGKCNDSTGAVFKFNSEKEYGNLYVKITGSEGPGFGELLDNSDKVVRKAILDKDGLAFEDLKSGKYYLRFVEDTNGNGIWDTGNYAEHRQPETVYYFHDVLTINKYSDNEIDWNIKQFPIDKQKPSDITKNKPAAKKQKRTAQPKQNQQKSGQSNPFGRSMPGMGNRMPRM